ncbi:enoyl-CoA hydratase/isomerase family protein [Aspergillus alliaceus]|uniref:enoyl-CoA hydratase/isomerase family protein n=1 Tax=Petromyces alliaceus TaxID=209559 RepID=UPI0012A4FBD6|nr:enoyl-CoA hydratase/isomerase family protein [Aspergillus alliaceus]KAB8229686.1 enoyl-CoA hydratase/isomerase family protein [Aspergillus alliaceus]
MATINTRYPYKYFTVRFPIERPYVAHVEINRADKLNTFIEAMWLEMRHVFDQLSSDSSVRAIVLTGAGNRAFSAGLDVKQASTELFSDKGGSDAARKSFHIRRYIHQFQECLTAIERCEKPVICAMHGFSYGFAIDISAAADIRLCTRDVQFSVKEVDIGMAADIGVLSRLPKVVGNIGWVKEVALSARIFGAEEALQVGFVNTVYDTKQAAVEGSLELASLIAQKSPVAVLGTKELLNYSRDHSIQEGLRYTAVWNSGAIQTGDVRTALMSGLEKRIPKFEKL